MLLKISPRNKLDNILAGTKCSQTLDISKKLKTDTVASCTYKIYDSSGTEVTDIFGGGSSISSGIITFGIKAIEAGSYTLKFIITCNEVLPDGITPREFYMTMTIQIIATTLIEEAIVANLLPKTGVTIKDLDGDDGDIQAGWDDGDRFTDNGNGTITDNATSLMWPKDFAGAGAEIVTGKLWSEALTWANELNFASYTDWRLPNLREMLSIGDYSLIDPTTPAPFINDPSSSFWTSTRYSEATNYAWKVDTYNYEMGANKKEETYLKVIAVRSV